MDRIEGMHPRWGQGMAVRSLALATLAVVLGTGISAQGQERTQDASGSDARFTEVARKVPEFGGAFISGGVLRIWLTDPSVKARDRAQAALIEAFGDEFDTEKVEILEAKYTFTQLFEWHGAIADVLSIDGAISTDIDDRSNRLEISVESLEKQKTLVEANLSRAGVALAAANIVQGSPVRAARSPNRGNVSWYAMAAVTALALLALMVLARNIFSRRRRSGPAVANSDPA